MSLGLRGTLIGAIVASTAGLVLTVMLLEDPLVEYRATEAVRRDLEETASAARRALLAGESPDQAADRLGAHGAARVRVLAATGELLGDTAFDGPELRRDAAIVDDSAIEQARAQGRGAAVVADPVDETERLHVARTLPDGRVVLVDRSTSAVRMAREGMRELLIVGGVLAAAIAVLLMVVLSRAVVAPIRELTQVTDALGKGNLSARARSVRQDELGALGRAFDHMADQLAERVQTLRAEEARLRTVLDSMVEAVFVTDTSGRIVLTNRALDGLVGTDCRGRTAVEAIRSAELHEAVRGARKGRPASVDLETRTGGEPRLLSAQVAPLPDGAGVVAVLHDVTELKKIDRVRRDFVANASHELRTPLTAVRGFAETLRDGDVDDPAAAKRFADMIVKHTLRLQRLVDDLLALSRAESTDEPLELGPLHVNRVVSDILRGLEAQASDRQVSLVLEDMSGVPEVRANERALEQILVNLIDNAIKYTPPGGEVRLSAGCADGRVRLEVADTGPGIPPQHLDRIFERFYRVDKGRSREVGGTGLGLAIVKHFTARMGADVEVESRVGEGTRFRVQIPRA